MIPRKIHYCWFGRNEKPKLAQKCIASWKKYCADYEIIEWNEDNFDVNSSLYTHYCYENKKWAYLSDYVRLAVVYENGGIYFDTDVELIKPLDTLLMNEAFFAFENDKNVATGLGFGAEKGSRFIRAMMEQYVFSPEQNVCLRGCPELNTKALLPFGLALNGERQQLDGVLILPADYMNPYDDPTGRLNITENTISIHWYSKSGMSTGSKIRSIITRPFHRVFGVNCFQWLKQKRGS